MPADLEELLELMTVPGPAGKESAVSDFIRGKFLEMGVPAEDVVSDDANARSPHGGETGNLIVRIEGKSTGERRMFSTHMDTVPEAVGCRPEIRDRRVVNAAPGRALGADARAGCAVLLAAARALMKLEGDHPPRTFVFFVQEEFGLAGSRELDLSLLGEQRPVMGFNFDNSRDKLIVSSVGGAERFTLRVRGVPAHSIRPDEGVSAALIEARALARLEADGWFGRIEKPEGTGTANLGALHGGEFSNVLMPELVAQCEARSFDAEFQRAIVERWRTAFEAAAARFGDVSGPNGERAGVAFEPGGRYESFSLPDDAPVVRAALAAARAVGLDVSPQSNDGGQDANRLVAHGIPAVGISYGGRKCHSPEEWLDLDVFEKSLEMAELLAAGKEPKDR
jgi:tripeptide aminopeptidase